MAALVAAISAAAVLTATAPHGPRVTSDSVYYLSTADSIRAGHGLVAFDGVQVTHWPPGFPGTVAVVGEVAGANSVLGARILNALCLAFIVLAGWVLLRRHVSSPALRLGGVAGLAIAPTLFVISSSAWSEPLFVALMLAATLGLELALERPGVHRWVIVSALLAGASFFVRYSGIWLLATGAFVLLVANRSALTRRERVQRAALFLIIASVLPALVIERNLRLTNGYPFSQRGGPNISVADAAADEALAIGRWLVPEAATSGVRAALATLLLGALAAWTVSWTRRRHTPDSRRDHSRLSDNSQRVPLWPLALLASGYLAFLLGSVATAYTDPIGPRLLSPAFVPGVVVAFAGVDRLLARSAPRDSLVAACAAGIVMWLGAQALATRGEFNRLRADGAGYTEQRWRSSELLALVRDRGIRPTFTTRTDALYFGTAIRAGCWPTQTPTVCTQSGPNLNLLAVSRSAYLAWFAEPGRTRPFMPAALMRRVRLTEVARVADGRLYRVSVVR